MKNVVQVTVEYNCENGVRVLETRMIAWGAWRVAGTNEKIGREIELNNVGRIIGDIFELGRQSDGE